MPPYGWGQRHRVGCAERQIRDAGFEMLKIALGTVNALEGTGCKEQRLDAGY